MWRSSKELRRDNMSEEHKENVHQADSQQENRETLLWRSCKWGFQPIPIVGGMEEFVAPSSSGLVRMPLAEIVAIYRQLAEFLSL